MPPRHADGSAGDPAWSDGAVGRHTPKGYAALRDGHQIGWPPDLRQRAELAEELDVRCERAAEVGLERRHRRRALAFADRCKDGDVLADHGLDLVRVLLALESRVGGDDRQLAPPDGFAELPVVAAEDDVDVEVVLE